MVMPNSAPPSPPGASPAGGEQIPPEELKRLLIEAVGKIRTLCEKNGLDFNEIISGAGGGSQPSTPPMGGGMPAPAGSPPGM